jgi:hypothetical protein
MQHATSRRRMQHATCNRNAATACNVQHHYLPVEPALARGGELDAAALARTSCCCRPAPGPDVQDRATTCTEYSSAAAAAAAAAAYYARCITLDGMPRRMHAAHSPEAESHRLVTHLRLACWLFPPRAAVTSLRRARARVARRASASARACCAAHSMRCIWQAA